ncbi:MAG: peptide ABC transporter substrate-binding protein [Bacillota bacterium]|nr:peptide ABC transporter substrate-binding protein [Bacillota bacterium]
MSRKKKASLLLTALLSVFLVAGCGGGDKQSGEKSNAKEQIIRYNVCAEPETLDPAKATGLPEGTILAQMFDGLTRYNNKQEITPALAESWTISDDGLNYTFKLRDAKWNNGDPVTANDFVYSWLRALDPNTASEYAYQLFYIKGAEEFNSGKGSKEQVAVKAVDEKTLQVTLAAPAPQFLGLTAFQTLYPINPKVDQASPKWTTEVDKYVSNGPFKIVSWEHNQKIVMEKNPTYWDTNSVKLDKLEIYLIENTDTGFTMFQSGQIDIQDQVPVQEMASLKDSKDLKISPDVSVYFYRFNVTKKPMDNPKVRKALTLAIDRQSIVENVTKQGQKPAFAFVPFGFTDADGKDFRQNGGDFFKEDVTEAKKLLAEAGYPEGKGFPKLTLTYNNDQTHQKVAEAIQAMWKKNLGIDITLENVEWQIKLNKEDTLDFELVRAGWSPDYLDPMSFVDMFVTNGGNNDTGWGNKEYDALVKQANATGDPKVRMEAMHKAEKILMEELPVMPIFFYTNPNLIKPNLKDVIVPSFGLYADFKTAYVE